MSSLMCCYFSYKLPNSQGSFNQGGQHFFHFAETKVSAPGEQNYIEDKSKIIILISLQKHML